MIFAKKFFFAKMLILESVLKNTQNYDKIKEKTNTLVFVNGGQYGNRFRIG